MNPSSLDPNHDDQLQALFDTPQADLDAEDFMLKTRNLLDEADRKRRLVRIAALVGVIGLAALLTVPTDLVQLMTTSLTSPLIQLGPGWSGWLLMPINNTGALLILLIKLIRTVTPRSSIQRGSLLPF